MTFDLMHGVKSIITDVARIIVQHTAWWWSGWDPELDPLLLELRAIRRERLLMEIHRESDGSRSVCL